MKTKIALTLCAFVMLLGPPMRARAEGNSISVSPAQVDIELSTTDTQKTFTFTLTNTYNIPVELRVDIMGIDQQSGSIIPSTDVDQALISSVRLSDSSVIIPEQSTKTVTLVIDATVLSPGGHYATVVFTQYRISERDVNLTGAISTGLFVVKRGGQLREVEASTYKLHKLPFQIPSSISLTTKNIGNVHVIPRSSTLIYNSKGDLVAKSVGNLDSRRILPGKELSEKQTIQQLRRLWWPQKLNTVLEYRADGIEEAKFIRSSFVYIPSYTALIPMLFIGICIMLVKRAVRNRRKPKSNLAAFGEHTLLTENQSAVDEVSIHAVHQKRHKSRQDTKKPTKKVKKTIPVDIEP